MAKKRLNPFVAFMVFLMFLIIGGVGGVFSKIYFFIESYIIPEKVSAIKEVSVGSLDIEVQ